MKRKRLSGTLTTKKQPENNQKNNQKISSCKLYHRSAETLEHCYYIDYLKNGNKEKN